MVEEEKDEDDGGGGGDGIAGDNNEHSGDGDEATGALDSFKSRINQVLVQRD